MAILNELLQSAKTFVVQGIEVCIATVSVEKYVGELAVLVHKLRDIENLDVIFVLAHMEDRVYLVGRSRLAEVNAASVASYFGGGGHAGAASATIREMTLFQVENRLLEVLKSRIAPFPTAEILMSRPVVFTDEDVTIVEAEQTMVRYNINAMPVLSEGRIVGIINRQVVEKAIFHGMELHGVQKIMSSDFATVGPEATLLEIQTHLVENQQRILPVMDGETVIGVVTRRDLLNFLVSDRTTVPQSLHEEGGGGQHWPKRKKLVSIANEVLSDKVVNVLRKIGEHAERMGFKAYAVGGFVRDLLLRRANLDLDIVVEGDGIEFAKRFAEENGVKVRSHKKFNTAMLIFPDGRRIDIATARFEYYQYPAALPIVEFSSLKMDLYRRDFTINTLALSLNPGEFAQLIDFFNGQRDLKDRTIRVLHNLSFVEDPTRILRAVRFEQRFGFKIGKQTATLIKNALRMGFFQTLGGRRFLHEIELILSEDDPLPPIRRMSEFGLLAVLSPDMTCDAGMEMLLVRLREAVSWYRLSFLDEPLESRSVYLLGLLSFLKREELEKVWNRFSFSPAQQERMAWTYSRTEELLRRFFRLPRHRPSDIYRALQLFRPEELLFIMGRAEGEEGRRIVSHYFHRYRRVETEMRGRDLLAMGIPPGPVYRTVLDELLDAKLNGEVKNFQEDMELLKEKHPELFRRSEEESPPDGSEGS